MDDSTLTILLAQFLALSVFIIVIVALIAWKLRGRYRRLMRAYVRLKKNRDKKSQTPTQVPAIAPESDDRSPDWKQLQEQALDRYRKTTGKTLGDYAQTDPFSARIASIRYLYLQAEQNASEQTSAHGRWQVLEKSLAKLVSILLENARPVAAKEPDKTQLLRERLLALQSVERDNQKLRTKANAYGQQLDRLKDYRKQYSNIVARLNSGEPVDLKSACGTLDSANEAYQNSVQSLSEHVTQPPGQEFYADKRPILNHIDQLREGSQDVQQHVADIRRSVTQSKEYGVQKQLLETFRRNNASQRGTILDLRHEIKCLQRAMRDEGQNESDTATLERLLRESEGCISTLESEVDFLQSQVQQQQSADLAAENAGLASILVDFALAVVDADSESAIFKLLLATLAQFNCPFALRTKFDGEAATVNRSALNDRSVEQMLEQWARDGAELLEGVAFTYARDHLQLFLQTLEPLSCTPTQVNEFLDTVHSLIRLQLAHLHDLVIMETQHRQVLELAESVRSGVTTIEIQYAYGTEETKRLVDNLIIEMRQLITAADIDDDLGEVFEAAINEAKQRFAILYEAGSAVDREIERLSKTLDQLQQ